MTKIHHTSFAIGTLLSLAAGACTAPTDATPTADPDSKTGPVGKTTDEPVAQTASALGGGLPRGTGCNGYPCSHELSWFGDHAHYVFDSTGDNHVILGNLNGGRWPQQDNHSGTFDAFGLAPGAMYYFQSQVNGGGCTSGGCAWSAWTPYAYLYIPDTGGAWLDSDTGLDEVTRQPEDPNSAFSAGFESFSGGTRDLKVCSVNFVDGQHVGRWFDGFCHIGWGGHEEVLTGSMILDRVDADVAWVWNNQPNWQANAIAGGWQNGPQYICRTWTANFQGLQPGKVVDGGCSIGWGNAEIWSASFQVLSRNAL